MKTLSCIFLLMLLSACDAQTMQAFNNGMSRNAYSYEPAHEDPLVRVWQNSLREQQYQRQLRDQEAMQRRLIQQQQRQTTRPVNCYHYGNSTQCY